MGQKIMIMIIKILKKKEMYEKQKKILEFCKTVFIKKIIIAGIIVNCFVIRRKKRNSWR